MAGKLVAASDMANIAFNYAASRFWLNELTNQVRNTKVSRGELGKAGSAAAQQRIPGCERRIGIFYGVPLSYRSGATAHAVHNCVKT